MGLFDLFRKEKNAKDSGRVKGYEDQSHQKVIIDRPTGVQIGQPSVYPNEMVNALKMLFALNPVIKAAYIAWIFDRSSGVPPHYIIGLDTDGDGELITREAGFTSRKFLKENEIIDFIRIDDAEGLSDYFRNETIPFYIKY